MHIPDGFLSLPVSTAALAATGIYGYFAHTRVRRAMDEHPEQIPLIGCTAGFIFAAQMLNFPVLGGTSGHFLGAALATFLFGPYVAFFVLTTVLIIQAFFFADGGLLALGGNVFLMGITAPWAACATCRLLGRVISSRPVRFFVAAWVSILAAGGICAVLLSLSGTVPLGRILPLMVLVHALIGLGEGLVTASAVMFIKRMDLPLPEVMESVHAKV